MKIENIKLKTKNNPNIFFVFFENLTVPLIIHSDSIVKNHLSVGLDLTNEEIDKITYESDCIIAFNKANKYIQTAVKSKKQITDYLYRLGYKKNVIDETIKKLNTYHIVDDKLYAECVVKNSENNKSKKMVELKLLKNNIDKSTIQDILQDFNEMDTALIDANKFIKSKPKDRKTLEKLFRHLSYKGYQYETILKTMSKLNFTDENF